MILGDFNAGSYSWWSEDMLLVEGNHIDTLTSMFSLHQVISGPALNLSQSLFRIDLIFTDQSDLVINCGIYAWLQPNCDIQITYCKLNLKITYSPLYKCLVWDYKKASSVCIKNALGTVNWDGLFHLTNVFNNVVINIFSNFVPDKIDDRDPLWMNDFIKT